MRSSLDLAANSHARLAEKTELAALGMAGYQAADDFCTETPRSGNPCDLQCGVGRTDMRVEPAAGAGHGVDRNRDICCQPILLSIFLRQLSDTCKGLVNVSGFRIIGRSVFEFRIGGA